MKIVWHMPTLRRDTCGLSNRAVQLACQLERRGHEIEFVVDADKTDYIEDSIGSSGLRRLVLKSRRPIHWSLQASAKRRTATSIVSMIGLDHDLFISCQPEVVATYADVEGRRPLVYVCGGTSLLHEVNGTNVARHTGPRRIAFGLDRYLKHCNESSAFSAADLVVFDSASTRSLVVNQYGVDVRRCHVVHGGVDPDEFQPASERCRDSARQMLGIGQSEWVVVWTGRLSPEKHVELLISSVPKMQRRPDRVILVGDGPSRDDLTELARAEGVENLVRFVGRQPDIRPFLHAADVFAFPSRSESFGGALVEAMACGLPCVAVRPDGKTVRNASAEILDHEVTGLLADRPEPGAFASMLDRLAIDASLCRLLGKSGRQRVTNEFTWSAGGLKMHGLLSAIGSRRPIGKYSRRGGRLESVGAG